MLHESETLTMSVKENDVTRLERNDANMVRRMCNVKPEDRTFGDELRPRLECLQDRRLQWFGRLEKMEESSSWSNKCRTFWGNQKCSERKKSQQEYS